MILECFFFFVEKLTFLKNEVHEPFFFISDFKFELKKGLT